MLFGTTHVNRPLHAVCAYDSEADREVIVKGDRRLEYKKVRDVMRIINEAGFTRVGLITEKKKLGQI